MNPATTRSLEIPNLPVNFDGRQFMDRYGIAPEKFEVGGNTLYYDDITLPEPADLIIDTPLPTPPKMAKPTGSIAAVKAGIATPNQRNDAIAFLLERNGF